MAFNIENFKAEGLASGGARPSLFKVSLPDWPGSASGQGRKLEFVAKATQVPPSILGQVEIPYFGRRIKLIGDRVYTNWNITVMNDEDFNIRSSLENWHQSLNDHQTNIMNGQVTNDPTTYKVDADVIHYGKRGEVLKTYRFIGIFPVSIDAIPLDWEAIDQVEQFDVEFAIDYWIDSDNNRFDAGVQAGTTPPLPARNPSRGN